MIWTTDKPTRPGWWWYRSHQDGIAFVLRVTKGYRIGLVTVFDGHLRKVETMEGHWSDGPIPEPEEES